MSMKQYKCTNCGNMLHSLDMENPEWCKICFNAHEENWHECPKCGRRRRKDAFDLCLQCSEELKPSRKPLPQSTQDPIPIGPILLFDKLYSPASVEGSAVSLDDCIPPGCGYTHTIPACSITPTKHIYTIAEPQVFLHLRGDASDCDFFPVVFIGPGASRYQ